MLLAIHFKDHGHSPGGASRSRGSRGALSLSSSPFTAAAMFCVELNQPVDPAPVTTRTPLDEWCSVFLRYVRL